MYDKCIELEPDNATTYVHKGLVLCFFLYLKNPVNPFKFN